MFLDCPPSISLVSENVFRAADALLVPLIPTTLSIAHASSSSTPSSTSNPGRKKHQVMAFFSMVDNRKNLHRELAEEVGRARAEVLATQGPLGQRRRAHGRAAGTPARVRPEVAVGRRLPGPVGRDQGAPGEPSDDPGGTGRSGWSTADDFELVERAEAGAGRGRGADAHASTSAWTRPSAPGSTGARATCRRSRSVRWCAAAGSAASWRARSPAFAVGDVAYSLPGWQDYAVVRDDVFTTRDRGRHRPARR